MISLPLLQIGDSHVAACDSFYSLAHESLEGKACQGLACFVARHLNPTVWEEACHQSGKLYCVGKCYAGPAKAEDTALPIMEVHAREPVVMERIIAG
ncbi:MAG TPA: NADH-quinone oxidoreductase subunit D, partial [Phycisphaerae bacterium]